MKYAWVAIVSICLMFTTGYARDLPDLLPKLEVTGIATCKDASKVRAILNDRIVKKGDVYEVVDGKLGAKIVVTKKKEKKSKKAKVVIPPVRLRSPTLEIGKITRKGVTVHYSDLSTNYIETVFVPIKKRGKAYGLEK